jgi:hypothetical protein
MFLSSSPWLVFQSPGSGMGGSGANPQFLNLWRLAPGRLALGRQIEARQLPGPGSSFLFENTVAARNVGGAGVTAPKQTRHQGMK